MTDNRLSLFYVVDGESTSNAFSVKVMTTDTIDDLKDAIKVKKTPKFDDIATDELLSEEHEAVVLHTLHSKQKLLPTDELSDVFKETPPKKTIHIIVQRPPPVQSLVAVPLPVHARSSTPFSDESRPGTPSGDFRVDIKKIADKFFATGSKHADFLDAYVRAEFKLPVTTTGCTPVQIGGGSDVTQLHETLKFNSDKLNKCV
ncbi:hypothetical protein CPB97_003741 [Podila verticillata]|nr:hypothetical protein CPB97_003741 [Podila verticillata]